MNVALDPIGRMPPFGIAHLMVIVCTVLLAIIGVVVLRRIRGTVLADRLFASLGWITLTVTILWTLWGFLPMNWNINESLPFHFSDALRIVTSIALITRAGWAIAISYFWGLTLNLQSVLTPDLNYFHIVPLEFTMYWFLHVIALLAPILLVWGAGYRPTWRGYGVAYLATLLWAGVAITANALTGANYAYLSRSPAGPSVLDFLGPWPVYILWEAVIIALVWALMTFPWENHRGWLLPYADRLRTVRLR